MIRLLVFAFLMVNENERKENDECSKPVREARGLRVDNHLADERERDSQTEANCDNQRRCEKHGIRPTEVGYEGCCRVDLILVSSGFGSEVQGSERTHQNDGQHTASRWEFKPLDTREM